MSGVSRRPGEDQGRETVALPLPYRAWFNEDALLEGIMQSTGETIWQVARGLQEGQMLLEHMAQHMQDAGEQERAEQVFAKARDLGRRAARFTEAAREHESLSSDNLSEHQPAD